MLLTQLEKSLCGLKTLQESDLTEIVYSAIHLCGFIDPAESEYAIEAVLEALEAHLLRIPDMPALSVENDAPS